MPTIKKDNESKTEQEKKDKKSILSSRYISKPHYLK